MLEYFVLARIGWASVPVLLGSSMVHHAEIFTMIDKCHCDGDYSLSTMNSRRHGAACWKYRLCSNNNEPSSPLTTFHLKQLHVGVA